jgi:hypothetical protein
MTQAQTEPKIAISVHLTKTLQTLLDEWIARRPPPQLDRSDAICTLLEDALERATSTIAEHPHTRVSGIIRHYDEV